jgi:hypothetical protein
MQYLVKPLVNHAGNSPLFYRDNAKPNVDRIYVITSVVSKLVVSQLSDGIITQEKWTESERQQWKIVPLENSQYANGNYYLKGTCKIECLSNQRVLEVPRSSTEDQAVLGAWNWGNTNNQKWRLVELDRGIYRIENINSGKAIDLRAGSHEEGAVIQQYRSVDVDNQKWLLSEVTPGPTGALFEKKATVYKNDNFNPPSQELGLGTYYMEDLEFGNDQISSVRVPEGVRVIMYEHADFKGDKRMLADDYDFYAEGDDFNDKTSAILVEEVATFYQHTNYSGKKLILDIGRYDLTLIGGQSEPPEYGTGDFDINWNDIISSMKVPSGLLVTLYEHSDFTGRSWVFNEDVPDFSQYSYPDFLPNDQVSSIIIKALGVVIPNNVLNFGDTISLKSYHGRWMSAEEDSGGIDQEPENKSWEKFTIWRAGDTKHNGIVSYGDIIAVKNNHRNKYITGDARGNVNASADNIGDSEKFVIVRAGNTASNTFVSLGDVIALQPLANNKYLCAMDSAHNWVVGATAEEIRHWEQWRIDTDTKPQNTPNESGATSVCGLEACPNDICGTAACGVAGGYANVCVADACGAAACGVAGSLVSVCGGAVSGIGVCGQDFLGAGVSGASACGAAVGGIGVCGADVCGAAACGAAGCGAAACGAAACGADACGADACGAELSGGEACGAEAGGIDACPADACGANACAINLCPADACGADACAIDVIPIIPGI